ncbi:hypothetical protein CPB85DRAFT_1440651 [Mucidula mucida]|nr:hypothetical protein CPB85DRAFT_1440651 [Mucidula mucida]
MAKTSLKALAAAVKPRKKVVADTDDAPESQPSRASKSKASNAWEAYKKKQHNIVGDAASIVSKAGSLGSVATSAVKKLSSKKRKASNTSSLESNKESVVSTKNNYLQRALQSLRKKAKVSDESVAKDSDAHNTFKSPAMDGPEDANPREPQVKPSTVAQDVRDRVEAIKKKAAMRAAAAEESESDEDNKVLAPGALDYSDDDDLPEAHTLGQKERAAAIEAKDLFSEGAVVIEHPASRKSSRRSMDVDSYSNHHDSYSNHQDDDDNDYAEQRARAFANYRSKASSASSFDVNRHLSDEDIDDRDANNTANNNDAKRNSSVLDLDLDIGGAELLDLFARGGFDLDGDDLPRDMVKALEEELNQRAAAQIRNEDEAPQRRKVPKLGNQSILQREHAKFPVNDPPGPVYRKAPAQTTSSDHALTAVAHTSVTSAASIAPVARAAHVRATPTTVKDDPPTSPQMIGGWLAHTHLVVEKQGLGSRYTIGKKSQSKAMDRFIGRSIDRALATLLGRNADTDPQPFSSGGLEAIAMDALLVTAAEDGLDTGPHDLAIRIREDDEATYSGPLVTYIVQRLIAFRSTFKEAAISVVPTELQLTKTDAGRARARSMIDDLTYHCGSHQESGNANPAQPYRAHVVQTMVTATLAKNATSLLNKYADSLTSTYMEGPRAQEREVPALMLALVVTAIHAVLMEWSRNSKDHFSGNNIEGAFRSHLVMLNALKDRKPLYYHRLTHDLFQAATGAQPLATHGLSNEEIIAATAWDAITEDDDNDGGQPSI